MPRPTTRERGESSPPSPRAGVIGRRRRRTRRLTPFFCFPSVYGRRGTNGDDARARNEPQTAVDPTDPSVRCGLGLTYLLLGTMEYDGDSGGGNNPWKILIYDKHTRGIISPLLSVSQLRSLGVTLHLLLHSDREPIPDVPAVYFVRPTQENLSIIARDCSRRLYLRSHLHFSTRMERPVMEEFARLVVNTGGLDAVASVHDQFVEFACLEDRLFTLNVEGSYVAYNDPGATEGDMEMAMNGIAAGLFSVVATMGSVPVIRCPRVSALLLLGRRSSLTF